MYKILIFLHKSEKNNFLNFFKNSFIPLLSEINGSEVKLAKVESNLLLELKYSHYCEITAENKDDMDRKLNTPAGRNLSKLLMESHQNLTFISINYSDTE